MEKENLKIVFISNYFNHHQKYLSKELDDLTKGNYYFIETEPMESERLNMGWGVNEKPCYVKQNYTNEKSKSECQSLINNADVVIIGSAPEYLIEERKKQGKLIFRYSERILKKSEPIKYPIRYYRFHKNNPKGSNIYMLCASEYTSSDYAKFGLFKNKCYKWGYFPECKNYDIDELISNKTQNSILWCARLIDWKHPEIPVLVAEKLKSLNVDFKLNIIGTGALEDEIKSMIKEKNLDDFIEVIGSMPPEEVRKNMEKSQIFLMTSDRQEGWGAVLNESMNSACAVIANKAAGAVPYLIKNGENGFAYTKCDIDNICEKIVELFNDKGKMKSVQEQAYYTISNEWNAKVAAERLIKLSNAILNGEKSPDLFEDGICSKMHCEI